VNQLMLHNPLPKALHHYESALCHTLDAAGAVWDLAPFDGIEGESTALTKGLAWARHIRRSAGLHGVHHVVLWPALGFWDLASLRALRAPCTLVFHDPRPLRDQFGLDRFSRGLARHIQGGGVEIVVHSAAGMNELSRHGMGARLLPHPLIANHHNSSKAPVRNPVVRVLGQYKPGRRLDVLERLHNWRNLNDDRVVLEVHGSGWPPVAGWNVTNQWYSEDEFDALIRTADAIVVPYLEYFQSGVAIRALENLIPVVSTGQWFESLYGPHWVGVAHADDWERALAACLYPNTLDLQETLASALESSTAQWRKWSMSLTA
jgi:hypothetical protein